MRTGFLTVGFVSDAPTLMYQESRKNAEEADNGHRLLKYQQRPVVSHSYWQPQRISPKFCSILIMLNILLFAISSMSLGLLIQSPSLSSHSRISLCPVLLPSIFAKAKAIRLKDRLLIHHVSLNTCLTAFNQILTWIAKSKSIDRKCKQKN